MLSSVIKSVTSHPAETVYRLTILYGLLHPTGIWYLDLPYRILAISGLLFAPILQQELFWFVNLILVLSNVVTNYWVIGSSQFLYLYWSLGLFLLVAFGQLSDLKKLARLLIGCLFICSVVWKLISPDFLSGNFLSFAVLTDHQFTPIAYVTAGVTANDIGSNKAKLPRQFFGPIPPEIRFSKVELITETAKVLSWWTLTVEVLVAACFLLGLRLRDTSLMLFMITSYPVAPVEIFSSLLAILGLAQAEHKSCRIFYLVTFLVAQLLFFRFDLLEPGL